MHQSEELSCTMWRAYSRAYERLNHSTKNTSRCHDERSCQRSSMGGKVQVDGREPQRGTAETTTDHEHHDFRREKWQREQNENDKANQHENDGEARWQHKPDLASPGTGRESSHGDTERNHRVHHRRLLDSMSKEVHLKLDIPKIGKGQQRAKRSTIKDDGGPELTAANRSLECLAERRAFAFRDDRGIINKDKNQDGADRKKECQDVKWRTKTRDHEKGAGDGESGGADVRDALAEGGHEGKAIAESLADDVNNSDKRAAQSDPH